MHTPRFSIFTDFDGTITTQDLGDRIFQVFGKFEEFYPRLNSGELTVPEYWRLLCASLLPEARETVLRAWALEQPADPYFREFVEFCREHVLPLTVVSDGFDVYINPILEREGAGDIVRFCNRLDWSTPEEPPRPVFPGADESCTCFCASCKRNALLRTAKPETLIVYIGDGYSDFCASEHADIIFAKKALAAYCNRNRLPHYPFTTFADVLQVLRTLLIKKRLKPRHQAFLRRKEAFEVE